MSYTLYTDRNENFECEVSVKNASLRNAIARVVVESADGMNFVFNGKIEGEKCNIPIRKLKGLLAENSKGNMFLEVIVEDTYFTPWKSEFVVEEHTSIKVKVNEQTQSSKPIVEVKVPAKNETIKNVNKLLPSYEISKLCERFNISRKTLPTKRKDFRQIVNEYFKYNKELSAQKSTILSGLKYFLK